MVEESCLPPCHNWAEYVFHLVSLQRWLDEHLGRPAPMDGQAAGPRKAGL
ncbi:MAG: hypothetical protein M1298_02535 [Chloroflexi bacterium]|nr:hypothetical protein [Chloroflexota bacterium]